MKTARFLFVFVAASAFLLAACGGAPPTAEPTAAPEQPQQPTAAEPTNPPPTAPVEPSAAEPTQPQYAPFCEAAPGSACEAPTVTILDPKYCVEKVPYVIMSVPAGTTYESQDLDLVCDDQMHSDGTMRVTCHSGSNKELVSYDLQLCNEACSTPALQMGTGQCPEGYGYDPANTCCAAPAPANSSGCTTFTVDIRTCPDPQ
jgi:hypothetical protein